MTIETPVQCATALTWRPDGQVRGTVAVLPGRGERPQTYANLARALTANGYFVRALPEGIVPASSHQWADEPRPHVSLGADTGALRALALAGAAARPDALILAGLPGPVERSGGHGGPGSVPTLVLHGERGVGNGAVTSPNAGASPQTPRQVGFRCSLRPGRV